RVAERITKLDAWLMTEIYGSDPSNPEQKHKPNERLLRAGLENNQRIVSDIFCAQALRAIREQKLLNSTDKKQNQDQEESQILDTREINLLGDEKSESKGIKTGSREIKRTKNPRK